MDTPNRLISGNCARVRSSLRGEHLFPMEGKGPRREKTKRKEIDGTITEVSLYESQLAGPCYVL